MPAGASPNMINQISPPKVPTLEEELQENPDLVYDPMQIRKMLLVKIGQLSESIKHVQSNNF